MLHDEKTPHNRHVGPGLVRAHRSRRHVQVERVAGHLVAQGQPLRPADNKKKPGTNRFIIYKIAGWARGGRRVAATRDREVRESKRWGQVFCRSGGAGRGTG